MTAAAMTPVISVPEQLAVVLFVPACVIAAGVLVYLLYRHGPMGGTWTRPAELPAADPEASGER